MIGDEESQEPEGLIVGAHLFRELPQTDPARIAEAEALRKEEVREAVARALQFGSKSPCIERTES